MMNIYIINNDIRLANILKQFFCTHGHKVQVFTGYQSFLSHDNFPFPSGAIILDIAHCTTEIMHFIRLIKENVNDTHIICISHMLTISQLYELIKYGANDIIEWPFAHQEILKCINSYRISSTDVCYINKHNLKLVHSIAKLSNRELEILALLIRGVRNKEIAYLLNLSTRTIELHRTHINNKLEVKTLMELVGLLLSVDAACLAYLRSKLEKFNQPNHINRLHKDYQSTKIS